MITPTIGRKIWFWPNQTNMFSCSVLDATQAFDATIVFVHGANRINIQTVDHVGTTYVLHNVYLQQEGAPEPLLGTFYCTWMPYQLGQTTPVVPTAPPSPGLSNTPFPTLDTPVAAITAVVADTVVEAPAVAPVSEVGKIEATVESAVAAVEAVAQPEIKATESVVDHVETAVQTTWEHRPTWLGGDGGEAALQPTPTTGE